MALLQEEVAKVGWVSSCETHTESGQSGVEMRIGLELEGGCMSLGIDWPCESLDVVISLNSYIFILQMGN